MQRLMAMFWQASEVVDAFRKPHASIAYDSIDIIVSVCLWTIT
jgi:hypothetical protein